MAPLHALKYDLMNYRVLPVEKDHMMEAAHETHGLNRLGRTYGGWRLVRWGHYSAECH
jgi:hypothetical protein